MFIFCWSSNFVENVELNESMAAKMASRVFYLVYYNCIKSEFEQIITQLRWSNKDNSKWLQGKFHWLLLSISYKCFTPYKHCNFTRTVLWYYHRAWVACGAKRRKSLLQGHWMLTFSSCVMQYTKRFIQKSHLLTLLNSIHKQLYAIFYHILRELTTCNWPLLSLLLLYWIASRSEYRYCVSLETQLNTFIYSKPESNVNNIKI